MNNTIFKMAASMEGKTSTDGSSESDFTVLKKLPPQLPRRHNDIYINSKSKFVAQLKKCEKLLESGESELFIHGLGVAVHIAINLALQLQREWSLEMSAKTSTVVLTDDLQPLADSRTFQTRERKNSAIHIRLYRTVDR